MPLLNSQQYTEDGMSFYPMVDGTSLSSFALVTMAMSYLHECYCWIELRFACPYPQLSDETNGLIRWKTQTNHILHPGSYLRVGM